MKSSTIKDKAKKIAGKILVVAFWLLLWEALSKVVNKEILLPSVNQVAIQLFKLCGSLVFWKNIALSCARVITGFLSALLIGVIMGSLSARFVIIHQLFRPILRIISATPVASFIILALVWIKDSSYLPIFITFLMVLPVVWNNIYNGIISVDKQLLELVRIYKIGFVKRIKVLYLPSLSPYIKAALTVGIGFAWKSGIAAEVIALPKFAIGNEIYNAKIYIETTELFAWTAAVVMLSFLFEKLSLLIVKKLSRGENI